MSSCREHLLGRDAGGTGHRPAGGGVLPAPQLLRVPEENAMKRVNGNHVIYAYAGIVWALKEEGYSVAGIRQELREKHYLNVGDNAIRSVLAEARPIRVSR